MSPSKRLAGARALALIAAIFILSDGAQANADETPPERTLPAAVEQALARLLARAANPAEAADAQTRGGVGVFRVGNDPACDFTAAGGTSNGLQFAIDQAINDGEPVTQIRIANTGSYVNRRYFINDIGDQSLELIGGYASCGSATPSGRTTIDRGTATAGPVFLIDAVSVTETVTLENLLIRNGDNPLGGGLEIRNNNFVLTRNLVVRDNQASNGGGISLLDSSDGTLTQLQGTSEQVYAGATAPLREAPARLGRARFGCSK